MTTRGISEDSLTDLVNAVSTVEGIRELSSRDGRTRYELRQSNPPMVEMLATHGGRVVSIGTGEGGLHVVAELPDSADVRDVVEPVIESYPEADLEASDMRRAILSHTHAGLTPVARYVTVSAGDIPKPQQNRGRTCNGGSDVRWGTHRRRGEAVHWGALVAVAVLVVLAGCGDDGLATETGKSTPTVTGTGPDEIAPTAETTGGPTDAATTTIPKAQWTVEVVRVIDGDTLEVRFADGHTEAVRLLGVDTPEVHVAVDPPEYEGIPDTEAGRDWLRDWGHKASEFARLTVGGETVTIAVDPVADRRGSYGRLLVYVYHDGTNFNRQLVEQGYARLYDSTFSKRDAFASAEATAQANDVGLWNFAGTTTAVTDGGTTLAIVTIHADAAGNDNHNLNDEYVVLKNTGSSAIDVSGWTMSDEAGHTFAFPQGFEIGSGDTVTIRTGSGTNTDATLYWGSSSAIWNNGGDTIVVRDGDGNVVLVREYS